MLVLGIDTSCYTTSVALVNNGQLICQKRQLLKVKDGQRGLQQSAAVFQHVQNLPGLIKDLLGNYTTQKVAAVCASTRPRPVAGSYMPVFTVAEGIGQILATTLQVPFLTTSHQEGHIMAGIWSAGGPAERIFLAVHISGGTTELLKVEYATNGSLVAIELLGGTSDLHAGQFIDRVGVAMGMEFPAGPQLEKLATASTAELRLASSVKEFQISFSGPESAAQRLINEGNNTSDIARAVENCIATSIEKLVRRGVQQFNIGSVLIVGGVAANQYIRNRLKEQFVNNRAGTKLYFAEPQFSTDNAVGVALIGSKINRLNKS